MGNRASSIPSHQPGLRGCLITSSDDHYQTTINNLPVEILGEIFVRCLPSPYLSLPSPYVFNAPMLLCRVCKHWREIAISLPILWATFSARPRIAFRSYPIIMKMWLDRSAAFPLTLAVRPWRDVPLTAISPIFFSEIHRWRDVTLQLCKDTANAFFEASHNGAPYLERLYLNIEGCANEQIIRLPATVDKFTSLRHLTLYSYREVPIPDLAWSHLKTINIHCPIAVDQCFNILGQCPSIVNCSLDSLLPPKRAVSHTQITLGALTALTLHSDFIDAGYILAHLTCPLLADLHIQHHISEGVLDVDAFHGFLTRSSPPLKILEITDLYSTEEWIVEYLKSPGLQSLTDLTLTNNYLGDKLVDAFTCPTTDDAVAAMPLLEKVSLDLCNSADSAFGTMVASRFGKTSLKELDVKFLARGLYFRGPDGPSKTTAMRQNNFEQSHKRDLELFEVLCRDGMKLTWSC